MLRMLSKLIPFNPRQARCVQYDPSLFPGKNQNQSWSRMKFVVCQKPKHVLCMHTSTTVHNTPSGKGTQPKIALSVHSSDLHLSYS